KAPFSTETALRYFPSAVCAISIWCAVPSPPVNVPLMLRDAIFATASFPPIEATFFSRIASTDGAPGGADAGCAAAASPRGGASGNDDQRSGDGPGVSQGSSSKPAELINV